MKFLRKHAEGAHEGRPDYWYGVIDGFGGTLWPTLFYSESDAREAAVDLKGEVVIVAARVLETEDGDSWPLPVRTPEIERAESEQDLAESKALFELCMQRSMASTGKPKPEPSPPRPGSPSHPGGVE